MADFEILTADWDRFAARAAGFPIRLRAEVDVALAMSGELVGRSMIEGGAAAMPKEGGLSSRVAASSADLGHDGPMRVSIRLKQPDGYNLGGMNAGHIRHPVFGEGIRVTQAVPANAFSGGFEKASIRAQAAIAEAVRLAIASLA